MARNPKSDAVHAHNGLLGKIAFARSAMESVERSSTTSDWAKTKAAELYDELYALGVEVKNNPKY